MLIVVTGASGFIGAHLRAAFERAGHRVVAAARPGPGRSAFVPFEPESEAFVGALRRGPDVLVHAAGTSQVAGSFADPVADFRVNTALCLATLEAVRKHAPSCRVVLLSSAAVYGDPAVLPASEVVPPAPISPYGHHKLMAEQLGRMFHQLFGLRTCAVRIFSAYGRGLRRQVVYDAVRRLRAAGPSSPAVFRGTGREARDFVHVEDVAGGVLAAIGGAAWVGEPYNLASGVSTTIAELTEIVRCRLGGLAAAEFDGVSDRGMPLVWRADIARLRALGFSPTWTLERGIAEIVAHWAEDHGTPA